MKNRQANARPVTVRASLAAIMGTVLLSGYASQAPAADDKDKLEEVQVTGSRIKKTTDFDTATPTTVVDADYLNNLGIVNVGDAIKELPANVSAFTPATTGNANFFAGSTVANLRGLNPFFGSRTLTLVDGQRFVPTNQGDGVDLNFIPTILIDRIDVVTGGASAAYGSGAITGVENFALNHTLEGGKVDMDYGLSNHNDAKSRRAAAAFGTSFFDGRGHIVFGYEGQKSDSLGCETARDWCGRNIGVINNPNAATAGQPQYIFASGLTNNLRSYSGVLSTPNGPANINAAGTGIAGLFNPGLTGPGGTPVTGLNPGTAGGVTVGGDGLPLYQYTNLLAPVDRNVGALFVKYKLTDTINLKIDGTYGKVSTQNNNAGLGQTSYITPDNAFLTPALSTALGVAGGFVSKSWDSQIPAFSDFFTRVSRISVGLDGRFGDSSWTWEGYYTYGDTFRSQLVHNNVHLNAYGYAVDSILVNGVPECRVTAQIANPALYGAGPAPGTDAYTIAQGCVPLNTFGTGPVSAAAQKYAFGYLDESLTYIQQVAAFNASGDLFPGFGAGAVKGAIGGEYRVERGNNVDSEAGTNGVPVPLAVHTDYLIQYGNSFSGKVTVGELFAETDLPLLRDAPAAKYLDLDLSVRESRYDNTAGANTAGGSASNNLTTWKASLIWDPIDWLRVRGSYSRDARAANFRELYYAQDIGAGGIFGFCGDAFLTDPCTWHLKGNAALKPETSDTYTFGLVFTPADLLPGFNFAADYAHIKITNAIEQASVQQTETNCFNFDIGCSAFTTYDGLPATHVGGVGTHALSADPAYPHGNVSALTSLAFNGAGYKYEGIDFSSSYRTNLPDGSNLTARLLATYVISQAFQANPGVPYVSIVGQNGPPGFLADNQSAARFTGNLSLTWAKGPFSTTGNMRYVSSGVQGYNLCQTACGPAALAQGFLSISNNSVPSYQIFGLTASYKWEEVSFAKTVQVWGGVDNLFDKEPPVTGGVGAFGATNGNGGTNPVFYDTVGRYFRVGLRATF